MGGGLEAYREYFRADAKKRESAFQAEVISLAKRLGWLVYHTRDSRGSEPGFPDLVLVKDTVLFVELKTDTGKLSEAQQMWQSRLKQAGAYCEVWRPMDMEAILKVLSNRHLGRR